MECKVLWDSDFHFYFRNAIQIRYSTHEKLGPLNGEETWKPYVGKVSRRGCLQSLALYVWFSRPDARKRNKTRRGSG